MKIRNAAILLDERLTSIGCRFNESKTGQEYTFICTKELALALKLGDSVLARKSDSSICMVRVSRIDAETEIDPDGQFDYHFAFQRIDIPWLEQLEAELEQDVKKYKGMQRSALRQQLLTQFKTAAPVAITQVDDVVNQATDYEDDVPF